jgi:hypothetical protein
MSVGSSGLRRLSLVLAGLLVASVMVAAAQAGIARGADAPAS